MDWLKETIEHYRRQGAPSDQTALASLLREVQREYGGGIPAYILPTVAQALGTKESFLQALIKRLPSLRLADQHCLELCSGPNCGKHTSLAACAEKLCKERNFSVKFVPCMRLCGKGPNIRWDGQLYHHADQALLEKLTGKDGGK